VMAFYHRLIFDRPGLVDHVPLTDGIKETGSSK
jgi:hypothetical protein